MKHGAFCASQPHMKMSADESMLDQPRGGEAELFWCGFEPVYECGRGRDERHNGMSPPPPGGEHEKEFL